MVAEVVAGLLAGSLALLSDAAHMLTDAASLALALVAARLAARPPERALHVRPRARRGALGAGQRRGAARARRRDRDRGRAALHRAAGGGGRRSCWWSACSARLVNVAAAWQLARAERRSLNVEGARAHVLADLYASLGAAAAGAVVLLTGFARGRPGRRAAGRRADAPLGLEPAARRRARCCSRAPRRACAPRTSAALSRVRRASSRSTTCTCGRSPSGFPALAAHVLVAPGDDCHGRRRELEQLLHDRFGIHHTTLQVDHEAERRAARHRGPPGA